MNRKELKQAGRKNLHKHYVVLTFVCILLALFGTEASYSTRILKIRAESTESTILKTVMGESTENTILKAATNDITENTILKASDVFSALIQGDTELGDEISQRILNELPEKIGGNEALGTTNGVLASLVGYVLSGRIYLQLASRFYEATQSRTVAGILVALFIGVFIAARWFFIRNIISVMIRRLFLEGRTYKKVPFLNLIHCFYVRQWLNVCVSMFLYSLFLFLWRLTIVGWFIKRYSYYLVPYIIAENPGMKGTQAITLSRKMMDGHKMEAFIFDLSFIGWYALALVTIGLSDAFYGFPYRTAARAEYYDRLRKLAKENNIPLSEELNDKYLYEVGDKITLYEHYFDVVDMQTFVHEEEEKPTGAKAFVLKWFSIWIGTLEGKKKYERVEGWKFRIMRLVDSRDGITYPRRLSPLWKERNKKLQTPFSFLRAYSIWTLILMFILFCFIGWCWEVGLYYFQDGYFVNRGVLHGPWLPVYGAGGIVVLLVCSSFRKKPMFELIVSVVMCGCIEYLGAYLLETKYHERWWSYDGYFLNIHGRVCAEGLIVFGIACMLVVYLIAPFFDFAISLLPDKVLKVIAIGLLAAFLIDAAYSHSHPNMSKGAITESYVVTEMANAPGALSPPLIKS